MEEENNNFESRKINAELRASNVFFLPWVGKDYSFGLGYENDKLFLGTKEHPGKRIMILGESHYWGDGCEGRKCSDCEKRQFDKCSMFTNETVDNYLNKDFDRTGWTKTYLKFERSLANVETNLVYRIKIWDHLLFYNFLQVGLTHSRQSGTNQEYIDAEEPFFKVLESYKPEYIIVWGHRLYWKMPYSNWENAKKPCIVDNWTVKSGVYKVTNDYTAKVMAVYHPSTGYQWDWWNKAIRKFVK